MTTLKKQIIDARSILDNGGIEQYGYYRLHKLLDKMEAYIDDDIGGADFTRYHPWVNGFFVGWTVGIVTYMVALFLRWWVF